MKKQIDREQVLDMLRTERECVCRDCDRECGKCDLSKERCWLLDMYDAAIKLLTDRAVDYLAWATDIGVHTCATCKRRYCDCPIENYYVVPMDGYCHLWDGKGCGDD